MKKTLPILFFSALLLLFVFSPVFAQSAGPTPSDDEVNAVAKQLFCPVCENTPLDVCPTQACAQWRDLIRLKLTEGWTEDQIKQYFVDQYGARVLSAPPLEGFSWFIYIIPPIFLAAGVYIVFRAFRAMRKPVNAAVQETPVQTPSDDYLRRVEEELKQRK
jgi:cytochrome c-type biogenesis protein CcmH